MDNFEIGFNKDVSSRGFYTNFRINFSFWLALADTTKMINKKTGILIFTRSHEEEIGNKVLLPSGNRRLELELAKSLVQQTLVTAKKARLPVIVADETLQKGSCFADRLRSAFEGAFESGFEQIICIGTDTPELNANHIRKAEHDLSGADTVLGKSKDGGVYLWAIKKEHFHSFDFQKIHWQTATVFETLKKSFASYALLEDELLDLDNKENLATYIESKAASLRSLILHLLCLLKGVKYKISLSTYISSTKDAIRLLRAPPLYHSHI